MPTITPEIKDFVNRVRLGFVATVCPDGTPNLSPKGTVMAWDEEHLIFADIHSPGTVYNMRSNPSTEINVVDIFCRKGYRFKGRAQVLSEGQIYEDISSFYKAAGSKHKVQNIILVKVEKILPILSPAYDLGLSEQEVRNRWVQYWDEINKENNLSAT
jgi:predicted pyridoxine 5'-phosphate oxidase superfamily flavin-nucleotide-binding protein